MACQYMRDLFPLVLYQIHELGSCFVGSSENKKLDEKKDSAGFFEDEGRLLKFNYCWMGRES